MGWFSDFVSDPLGTVTDTAEKVVSDPLGSINDVVRPAVSGLGNLTTQFDDMVNQVPGGYLTLAAIAGGQMDPSMFAGDAATGGAIGADAAGWDAATAGAYGGPAATDATWGSALGEGAAGQASNLGGLKMTGSEGLKAVPNLFGGTSTSIGTGLGGTGLNAPATGFFSGMTPMGSSGGGGFDLGSLFNKGISAIAAIPLKSAMIGSSLYDMYAKNKMATAQQQRFNQVNQQINDFYAPGSPEYNRLLEETRRSAAAAGRPFNNADFQSAFAAKLADKKLSALSNTLQQQNQLQTAGLNNQYGGLNTMFNNLAMYQILNKRGYV